MEYQVFINNFLFKIKIKLTFEATNNTLIFLGVSLRVGLLRASLRSVLRCSPHP